MSSPILLYGHAYCASVRPVAKMLHGAGAEYTYIDILQDKAALEQVRGINRGNESVPTLVFPDGSTLTEPSYPALTSKLKAMGYTIPLGTRLSAAGMMYSFLALRLLALIVFVYGVLSLIGLI